MDKPSTVAYVTCVTRPSRAQLTHRLGLNDADADIGHDGALDRVAAILLVESHFPHQAIESKALRHLRQPAVAQWRCSSRRETIAVEDTTPCASADVAAKAPASVTSDVTTGPQM